MAGGSSADGPGPFPNARAPGDSTKSGDKLLDLRSLFDYCAGAASDQMDIMNLDMTFSRLGQQWPAEIKTLRGEDRPALTINKMPAFIRQVTNDARQNRPQIKVKPTDGHGDVKTAHIFAGLIRQIEASSQSDIAYDTALDHSVSGGVGYFRVDIDFVTDKTFDKKLSISRVQNPFSVYPDPDSKEPTSKDWNRAFLVDYMSKEDFRYEFKGAEEVDWDALGYNQLNHPWMRDQDIMICEAWVREKKRRTLLQLSDKQVMGVEEYQAAKDVFDMAGITVSGSRQVDDFYVTQYLMSGAEILDQAGWFGKYIPIIPVYGEEVFLEGRRRFYSLIHHAKDAQRMFNYWRTASTEVVALSPKVPWVGEEGSFDVDKRKWENANKKAYPFLEYKKGRQPPQRQPLDSGQAIGAMSEALAASDDMKAIIGLYDASLGQRSNETSGKAILTRQREGDVSTFHFIDNLARAIQHCGNILVDLIPKVYTPGRIIRILGEDGRAMLAQLGQPQPAGPMGVAPPQGPPMPGGALAQGPVPPGGPPPSPQPGMPPQPPLMGAQGPSQPTPPETIFGNLGPGGEIPGIYDLNVGVYDVVIDTGPSFTTRREEIAYQMMELVGKFPQIVPVIGDILVKALDWPQAEEIAERIRKLNQGGQIPPELQKQIQEGMQKIQQLEQENAILKSKIQIEAKKAETLQFDAETDRIKVIGELGESATDRETDNRHRDMDRRMGLLDKVHDSVERDMDRRTAANKDFASQQHAERIGAADRRHDSSERGLDRQGAENLSVIKLNALANAPRKKGTA